MTKLAIPEHLTFLLALALILVPSGCVSRPLLHDVSIRPQTISPNADGVEDVAEIKYSLSRQSRITIYLVDQDGNRHYFRDGNRRSKGERTAYFGGVIDGTLLPDGQYTCFFVAEDEHGYAERLETKLIISGGDKVPLRIENLNIWPQAFTPNRDGITDRVTIGYNLNKQAELVEVYLLDDEGNKYPVPEDEIREMGAPGTHEHDYDAGIDRGATPPPDGTYIVIVEAVDAVGNEAKETGELTIRGGGVPRVEIVNRAAKFSPQVVSLGETLTFTCTVKNIGTVPVRTKGPEPGTTYSTSQNFNTLGEHLEPGIFRVGLDFEGNSLGRTYPFRWQLGMDEDLEVIETEIGYEKYLMPDHTVTVVGHLRIDDRPFDAKPYYWIGLIHEEVEIVQDNVEPTQIAIAF
ncbi:MAG: hypothetical protein U9R48_08960 [Chloroflexota bacterium]|nr:hypothetical protein [Chloroflexota bacterium]